MARCEDFPCCGHESGCCPDYDPETGRQLNMKCTCGATVPLGSRYSLCEGCLFPGRRSRSRRCPGMSDLPGEALDAHDLGEMAGDCADCDAYEDGDYEDDVDYGDYEDRAGYGYYDYGD